MRTVGAFARINADTYLTSHEVGQLLQCNPSSVNKWIGEEKIVAHRTPGGHRRIRAADLVAFLQVFEMPIPAPLQETATLLSPVVNKPKRKRRA